MFPCVCIHPANLELVNGKVCSQCLFPGKDLSVVVSNLDVFYASRNLDPIPPNWSILQAGGHPLKQVWALQVLPAHYEFM